MFKVLLTLDGKIRVEKTFLKIIYKRKNLRIKMRIHDRSKSKQTSFSERHNFSIIKLSCDSGFQRAFTGCVWFFKVIMLVCANQGNFFENATACSKRSLKTTVAIQL